MNDQERELIQRRNQFEVRLEECLKYRSDPSDEEDQAFPYELEGKLRAFKENPCDPRFNYDLSFITHAVAIEFLYSPEIQYAYTQKRRDVYVFEANFDFYQLEASINESATQIFHLNQGQIDQETVRQAISNKIYSNLEDFFEKLKMNGLSIFFRDLTGPVGNQIVCGTCFLDADDDNRNDLRILEIKWKGTERFFSLGDLVGPNQFRAINFYSNLRLLNRLIKIQMGFNKIETYFGRWLYSDNNTVDMECGTKPFRGTVYRLMPVKFNGVDIPYSKVFEKLRHIEDVDTRLLQSFTNGWSQFSADEASLHCMLFGSEVARNPSALIHNMMLLELTNKGKFTWQYLQSNTLIPMGRPGAERASRLINHIYNDYMPHKYSYDNYERYFDTLFEFEIAKAHDVASTILEKERELISAWLEMKFGEERKEEIKNDAILFYGELKNAIKQWYNVVLLN